MNKAFKYQNLIDEKGIKEPCPFKDCVEFENPAFRWGHDPLEHVFNFLPNYPYNEAVKAPPRRNSKKDETDQFKCGMCALSFFHTKEIALEKWAEIGEPAQSNLKYTHVLYGEIKKEMGVAKGIEDPHYLFYEYEGIEMRTTFKVLDKL